MKFRTCYYCIEAMFDALAGTEPYVILEQKGIDPIQVRNHMIFIVASNEDAAVPADLGDRRWQVLEVADNHRDDKPYFRAIIDQLNNGGREAFLHELLARDISTGPDPRRTIKTAGLFEQTIRAGGPDLSCACRRPRMAIP